MALFGKDRDRNDRPRVAGYESVVPEPAGAVDGPTPERSRTDEVSPGTTKAFLGKGSRVSGKLVFEGPAHIEGQIDGEITAHDALTIGEGAIVNAQIIGESIVIHGKVTGDVTAKKRLEIRSPAVLVGNVSAPSLVIHEGVVFEGQCAMGAADARDRRLAVVGREAAVDPSQRKLSEFSK